jgi:predicted metalloprotease
MTDHACLSSSRAPDRRVETPMASTDATVSTATRFRDMPVFDSRAARITRPSQVLVQDTIRTASPPGEPASPFVPPADAVRGFVFGVAAARLNEVT